MLSPFQEEKEFHYQRWKWLRCHPSALYSQAPSSQDQLLGPIFGKILVVIVPWCLWCLPRYCCVLGSNILSSGRSVRKIIWNKDILRLVKYRFPISYVAHSWLAITIPSIMCVVTLRLIDLTFHKNIQIEVEYDHNGVGHERLRTKRMENLMTSD